MKKKPLKAFERMNQLKFKNKMVITHNDLNTMVLAIQALIRRELKRKT